VQITHEFLFSILNLESKLLNLSAGFARILPNLPEKSSMISNYNQIPNHKALKQLMKIYPWLSKLAITIIG